MRRKCDENAAAKGNNKITSYDKNTKLTTEIDKIKRYLQTLFDYGNESNERTMNKLRKTRSGRHNTSIENEN